MRTRAFHERDAACLLVLAALAVGCARSNPAERYIPPEETARAALSAAIDAWQQGSSSPLRLPDNRAVQVIDQHRRPGQTLTKFEILGQVSGDGGRWFEVRLQLDRPAETQQVRYVVVGIDPLWIFRQPDYEMLAHWDHPMPEDTDSSPANRRPKRTSADRSDSRNR